MNVLVTGGAGYIGNLLVEALLSAGHKTTILDNFMYGYDSILHLVAHPNLRIIKTDIRNEDLSYLKDQDVVIHLAAISGYPACEANPNSAELINFAATKRIAGHLAKGQLLIFASTTSLYGANGSWCHEDTDISPASLYGTTKYRGEQVVMERENSISLRWATVFGVSPRMRAGLLLHDFVEKAVHEGTLVLYSADSKRSFMHVKDCVNGYIFALQNADQMCGQIYNMGDEALNYSKREIAEKIRGHFRFEIVDSSMGDKDVRHFYISFKKASALGYTCQYSLDEGIGELVKLYQFYDPNSFIRPI